MNSIRYPAILEPAPEGGFTVTFPDIEEAVTEGDDLDAAIFNAAEALTLCLEQRIDEGVPIPKPGRTPRGAVLIEPAAAVQAAVLIRRAREDQGRSVADLARALHTSWPAAQRLERSGGNPTIKQLERAAAALGKRLVVGLA